MLTSILQPMVKPVLTSVYGGNSIVFTDNFTDADNTILISHTADTGQSWIAQTGFTIVTHAKIVSNRLVPQATTNVYRASFIMPSANYEVEAILSVITNAGAMGVTARASNSANTLYAWRFQSNQWLLIKVVAGSITTLATYNNTPTAGQTIVAKILVNGSTIQGYLDGVLRANVTDTAITSAGSVGLRMPSAVTNSTGIHVDSIVARLI